MKVYEYVPLYGLLFNFEYYLNINEKQVLVSDYFDNHSDSELTDSLIEILDFFDKAGLAKALQDNYFTNETIPSYLRYLFDRYRESGGNPLNWLRITLESVNLNPQNYREEIRTILEKTLIELIGIYEKLPVDYLFRSSNPDLFDEAIPYNKDREKLWFRVGMLFATGEIDILKKEFDSNYTKIAMHLGNKSLRVYLTESVGTSDSDKNIFKHPNKLHRIKRYCDENQIQIVESFLNKISPI